MPGPRPNLRKTQGLHNLGRGGQPDGHHLTTCKLCPAGVYEKQPRVWLRKPAGWSHEACAEREGLL